MDFLISDAFAQAGGEAGGSLFSLLPLVVIFALFYFLLIRPQQKRTKQHKEMIANLKKGDKIITSGGLHGHITGLDEMVCTVEIADRVRIKIARANISSLQQPAQQAAPAKK